MSTARYNLEHGDPSHGDHATLIANWVEERALRTTTGHTRHSQLALEKVVDMRTFHRCIAHSDDQQRRSSLYKEEFKEHSIDPNASKVSQQQPLTRTDSRTTNCTGGNRMHSLYGSVLVSRWMCAGIQQSEVGRGHTSAARQLTAACQHDSSSLPMLWSLTRAILCLSMQATRTTRRASRHLAIPPIPTPQHTATHSFLWRQPAAPTSPTSSCRCSTRACTSTGSESSAMTQSFTALF